MTATTATEAALVAAETVVQRRGAALTPIRREVLSQLVEAKKPVGAYALLDQIKRPKGRMMPATVYRALDFLMEHGFVHRIESMNAFVACNDLAHPDHEGDHRGSHGGQFLICTGCGLTLELEDGRIAADLRRAAEQRGFSLNQLTVEMRGRCESCRAEDTSGTEPLPS